MENSREKEYKFNFLILLVYFPWYREEDQILFVGWIKGQCRENVDFDCILFEANHFQQNYSIKNNKFLFYNKN